MLRAGPNASVHAYSAAQVKAAMDATLRLGGENYVFWGGREGYHTLLNTDLKCASFSPPLPDSLMSCSPALAGGMPGRLMPEGSPCCRERVCQGCVLVGVHLSCLVGLI